MRCAICRSGTSRPFRRSPRPVRLFRPPRPLNVTPAALTARVKGLEDAVALKLFDRTASGMRLTKTGEAALEASRGVERAVRDFADAMLALSTGEGGRLSVGAVSTAKYFAPKLIAAFVASRPKVDNRAQDHRGVQRSTWRALSRCRAASAKCRHLRNCQAAATAVRHVVIAAARSTRCVWAEVRWRWTLKVL